MRLYHPPAAYQGVAPENTFCVADELGHEMAVGFVIQFYQPDLYPDRPQNLYLQMDGQPAARYMLFGALLARARQLWQLYPQYPARLYAQTAPEDVVMNEFYRRNGFETDDGEDLVRLMIPEGSGKIPMSCAVNAVTLATVQDQQAFLYRLNQTRIAPYDMNYLNAMMRRPHFLALALACNGDLAGEALLAGEGSRCDLLALYTAPAYRRMGMATALLHRSMALMQAEGVSRVNTVVLRRSAPQCALASAFHAKYVKTLSYYPGMNLP